MRIFVLLPLLLFVFNINAQTNIQRCHSDEIHENAYQSNENYRHWYDQRKLELDERIEQTNVQGRLDCIAPVVIPIAVHYEGVGSQSLSCLTTLALSQIEALNEDYSASNPDISGFASVVENTDMVESSLAAEGTCIQFCLADSGHPAGFDLIDGDYAITINQDYVANGSFPNFTNGVWSGYLNIFVTAGTGVLGYSPLFGDGNGSGVVIEACAFGVQGSGCGGGIGAGNGCSLSQYNLGRTSTHEIGHYLGLQHIWGSSQGNGSCSTEDGFSDTPNASTEYFGCPNSGSSCGSDDMYMNYMDYVDDACMFMFSEQQAALMYNSATSIWGTNTTKCSASVTENDARISDIVFPTDQACGTSIAPKVELTNVGQFELTTVDIVYNVENGGSNTYNWTGSLQQNENVLVFLSAISNPDADYVLTATTNNPNGVQDENPTNDEISRTIVIIDGATLPFTEDVENFTSPFPAQGIVIFNPDGDEYVWDRRPGISGNGNGIYSVYYNNFDVNNNAIGKEDWFILPEMDATGFQSVDITYDFANTYFSDGGVTRVDSLAIMYSYGCSDIWQEAWIDGGVTLSTSAPTASFYLPSASDWVNKSLGINTLGNDFIRIAFVNKSGKGNCVYLDNINIQGSDQIIANENIESLQEFVISPNPFRGILNMQIEFEESINFELEIHDVMGRVVFFEKHYGNNYQNQINMSDLANGIYFISLIADEQIVTKKVILNK
jgi:hypothetical protein